MIGDKKYIHRRGWWISIENLIVRNTHSTTWRTLHHCTPEAFPELLKAIEEHSE